MSGRVWLLLLLVWLAPIAAAHKPSDSYLTLELGEAAVSGRWDIALRDLDYAIGLDGDGDGVLTWGEVRRRHTAVAEYALARLSLTRDGQPCRLTAQPQLLADHVDGPYTVLRFSTDCAATAGPLRLRYRLLFDLDPSHRGLVRLNYPDATRTAVLAPQRPSLLLEPVARGRWAQLLDYWREGVWHIWIGFDHILFLLALLLPTVVSRRRGRWQVAHNLTQVLLEVAAVVSAFTVAHSITLGLAATGWVDLPSRWVETAIAATVVLAALNNLYPLVEGKRWLIAFLLGLIHGFGFAGVLADLGLPNDALLWALAGFNLGVECGQLAIVLLFVPLAFAGKHTWIYRRGALQFGSLAVAAVAGVWLFERGLAVDLLRL